MSKKKKDNTVKITGNYGTINDEYLNVVPASGLVALPASSRDVVGLNTKIATAAAAKAPAAPTTAPAVLPTAANSAVQTGTGIPPTANPGSPQSVTMVSGKGASASLNGKGSINAQTYAWSQISGPANAVILSPGLAVTNVNFSTPGVYTFELTVSNSGGRDSASVSITVNSAGTTTTGTTTGTTGVATGAAAAPVADAGQEQDVTLPNNGIILDGSNSYDPNGLALTYSWAVESGPNTPVEQPDTPASIGVAGLQVGIYVFQLTVTNTSGLSSTAQVTVNVSDGSGGAGGGGGGGGDTGDDTAADGTPMPTTKNTWLNIIMIIAGVLVGGYIFAKDKA